MQTGWNWKDFAGYKIPAPTELGSSDGKRTISSSMDLWAGTDKDSEGAEPKRGSKRPYGKDDKGVGNKPGY